MLNFACFAIVPGRAFLRRLIDLTCGISKPFYWVRLTKETRADLTMLLQFISQFNGKSVFLAKEWDSSDFISLYTDASGPIGFSAVLGEQWFAQQLSKELLHFQNAIKELFPIVLALEIWGYQLQNKKILLLTDNMAIAQVINKQSSKDKSNMRLVRRLVLACLFHNIHFKAKHIEGKMSVTADRLSRFQLPAIRHRIDQRIKRQYQSVCCTFDQPDTILLSASLAASTQSAYRRSWQLLQSFQGRTTLPLQVAEICNFIAYPYSSQFSASTISSHISAFSYVHKLLGLPDPSQMFIVKKLLRGCHKMGRSVDSRLPITRDIL